MPPATYPFIEPLLMSQAPYGMGPNSEVMTTYTADQGKAALPQTLSFNTNVCVWMKITEGNEPGTVGRLRYMILFYLYKSMR